MQELVVQLQAPELGLQEFLGVDVAEHEALQDLADYLEPELKEWFRSLNE